MAQSNDHARAGRLINGNLVRWLTLVLSVALAITASIVSCDRRFNSIERRIDLIEEALR